MRSRLARVVVRIVASLGLLLLPSTLATPYEKVVSLGDSVSIPCPLTSPGGSVQWLQDGDPVVLDVSTQKRRHWKVSADGTAALTIVSVKRTDAGVWECRELRSDGSVLQVARIVDLVVGSAPHAPFLQLEGRRLAHQATVTVRENTQLTVQCVVPGTVPPVHRVHWLLDDTNVTAASELFVEFSALEDSYISRSVLEVNVTRQHHRKELVCEVHHISWLTPAAASASMNVLYVPSFSISREPGFGFPILEGMAVSLRCDVDANPPSFPQWIRDSGPVKFEPSFDGFLNFTSINRSHAGWYRCSTQHELGPFASFGYFLNVRPSPEGIQPQDDVRATPGEVVRLECANEGKPDVSAVNKSIMAIAGRSALLLGLLCANPRPQRVHWIVRHIALQPGDFSFPYIAYNITDTETPHCYSSALEIRRVSPEDAGEVMLVAKNSKGIDDAVFMLNVTQASFSVSRGVSTWDCSPPLALLMCLVWGCSSVDWDGS